MDTLRWGVAGVLGLLAVVSIIGNACIFVAGAVFRRRLGSWVPYIGGVSGCVALLVVPIAGTAFWCWVPLLADWGCIPGEVYTLL
ncbi:MAG: hypothetical protein ACYSU0_19285, partial [Planctomycetota bacterium]